MRLGHPKMDCAPVVSHARQHQRRQDDARDDVFRFYCVLLERPSQTLISFAYNFACSSTLKCHFFLLRLFLFNVCICVSFSCCIFFFLRSFRIWNIYIMYVVHILKVSEQFRHVHLNILNIHSYMLATQFVRNTELHPAAKTASATHLFIVRKTKALAHNSWVIYLYTYKLT